MNDQWYYEQHGVPHGPLAGEQLQQLVAKGAVPPTTLVWREGLTEWTTAAAAGFQPVATSPQPPPLPVPPPIIAPAARANRRAPPPTINWPLVIGGGAAALVVAALGGWFANALLRERDPPRQIAAAAPSVPDTVNPAELRRPAETPRPSPRPAPAALPSAKSPSPSVPASSPTAEPSVPAKPAPAQIEPPPVVAKTPTDPATQSTPPAPSTPPPQTQPSSNAQTLYQEIDIQRAPKFSILGSVTAQELHYKLLSELHAAAADEQGVRKIEQYVRSTQLLKADELSQGMFEQSLRDLEGWQFTFKVNRRGDILEWKGGPPAGRKTARVEQPGAAGFMVTSVLDEDGWKEMAQLSFFVPEEQTAGSQTWVRKMTHDFGPLGSWVGETHYTPKEASNPLQIDYVHRMTYKPPARGIGGLPFAITDAKFTPEIAAGAFLYDKQASRVIQVQERFLVKGSLATELLGQAAAVEMEEDQLITVRLLEQNPWEQ
ncbi:MAG TPA: DUF4339 domain-containing protein [Pirellulaceae bacterium]|nr:DUF4339 domain-containing protein [Pirellulaceae bacterium]